VSTAAAPGEVLVTEAITRLAHLGAATFEEIDPASLKGVSTPVRLFPVRAL